jgi:hypothetical protein
VLYLRGFSSDSYDKLEQLDNAKEESYKNFSEYWFFKFLRKRFKQQVVSIGMTKELDSPHGSLRIYLDDEDWKDGVITLMNNAEFIYILIDARESCIWEIINSKDYLSKTVFISENQQKYDTVRNRVKNIIQLPEANIKQGQCISISFNGNGATVADFENSRMGYANIYNVKYRTRKSKRKVALWGCLIPFLIIFILAIVTAVKNSKGTKDEAYIEDDEILTEATTDAYSKIEEVISEIKYPIDLGNGIVLTKAKFDKEEEAISYIYEVDVDSIDIQLLRANTKSNIINSLQEDIDSSTYDFFICCINLGISIEYVYTPNDTSEAPIRVLLKPKDLETAFSKRKQ